MLVLGSEISYSSARLGGFICGVGTRRGIVLDIQGGICPSVPPNCHFSPDQNNNDRYVLCGNRSPILTGYIDRVFDAHRDLTYHNVSATVEQMHLSTADILAISLAIAGGIVCAQWGRLRRRPLPPGPRRVPLLGNILQIPLEDQFKTFTGWGNVYGGYYSYYFRSNT